MANVLLVIGNGFDQKCGLPSNFSQYLESDYYKPYMNKIEEIDKELSKALKFPTEFDGYSIYDHYVANFFGLSFWDLYFGLPHFYKFRDIQKWCDFEKKINCFINSFVEFSDDYQAIIDIERTKIKVKFFEDTQYKRKLILYLFLKSLLPSIGEVDLRLSTKKLNLLLFEQLQEYEKKFGQYIYTIQKATPNYISTAESLINNMLDKKTNDKLVYVNSFNYSDITPIIKDVWFINGDIDMPIFGVDYPDTSPYDMNRYRYTKTYRRLELTGKDTYYPRKKEYTKIIVYGHSLNSQDYSYFFALFNVLDLKKDRSSTKRSYYIEFAYSKYGEKTSKEVRDELISRVLNMFYAYNKEVLNESNFRLIDILFATGAIRFKEIE